jgi:hypothetical protein
MVILKSGFNELGTTEYYLVGLEHYDDFDIVVNQLKLLNIRVVDTLDGIYSRIATFEVDGTVFKVIYHEDVGTFSFIEGQQSQESKNLLQHILEKMVIAINMQMG